MAAFGHKTLLQRGIETALEAFGLVYVSTDSRLIADHAVAAGAVVPELRPSELATDTSTSDDVLWHAMSNWCRTPASDTIAVITQVTSPFTLPSDLTAIVEALMTQPRARCGLSVTDISAAAVAFSLVAGDDGLARWTLPQYSGPDIRSQDLPSFYQLCGNVFAVRAVDFLKTRRIQLMPAVTIRIPRDRSLDIDTESDLELARKIAGRR